MPHQKKKLPQLPQLTSLLSRNHKAGEKTAVIGVGSELHGDDAAGLLTARALTALKLPGIFAFEGATAPENITGAVIQCMPKLVLFVDAAEMSLPAGEIRVIPADEIGGMTFSTHTLPLPVIADYLSKRLTCQVLAVGIQPAATRFNSKPSESVRRAARNFCSIVAQAISER